MRAERRPRPTAPVSGRESAPLRIPCCRDLVLLRYDVVAGRATWVALWNGQRGRLLGWFGAGTMDGCQEQSSSRQEHRTVTTTPTVNRPTVVPSGRLGHRPAQLSGGQPQRVAVAHAAASKPEIIFGDEPTGNLDSRSGAEVLGFLRNPVRELGQTVVMVTTTRPRPSTRTVWSSWPTAGSPTRSTPPRRTPSSAS